MSPLVLKCLERNFQKFFVNVLLVHILVALNKVLFQFNCVSPQVQLMILLKNIKNRFYNTEKRLERTKMLIEHDTCVLQRIVHAN
jgi:hypothetical protein